jgi:HEPN domain-containing protein
MRIEVRRLIKQADRDLENARKNISIEAYEVAAFLAERAVEK